MKKVFIIFAVFVFLSPNYAAKIKSFPELGDPRYLVVDNDQIIVSDHPHIYIYSLKDFSLMKKVGRTGMGPGEFFIRKENMNLRERGLYISVRDEHISVTSMARLSFFSREGEFINETRTPYGMNAKYLSLGKKILGFLPGKGKISLYLLDLNLKKEKKILEGKYWLDISTDKPPDFFDRSADTLLVSIYDGKIFMARGDNPHLSIDVYDFTGKKRYTVTREAPEIEIPKSFRKRVIEHFKIKFGKNADFFIKGLELPECFPAIRHFTVVDGTIYVFTFKRENNNNVMLELDLNGKYRREVLIPIREQNPAQFYPYSIYKQQLYQLVENEAEEIWELYREDIK